MYGMYLYGKETHAARNTVFHDDHDMGGMSEEEKGKWIDMDLNYYIGIEDDFNKMADKYKG